MDIPLLMINNDVNAVNIVVDHHQLDGCDTMNHVVEHMTQFVQAKRPVDTF